LYWIWFQTLQEMFVNLPSPRLLASR
jgi:hypothetical protein